MTAADHVIETTQTLDSGRLIAEPPKKAIPYTDEIARLIMSDDVVSALEKKGYEPSIEFGAYTDTISGTPLDGVSPEEAASMQPTPSERQELMSQPLHLTFDKTPSWIVLFDDLPAKDVRMLFRGPAMPQGSNSSSAVDGLDGSVTVMIIFSPDAKRELSLRTF